MACFFVDTRRRQDTGSGIGWIPRSDAQRLRNKSLSAIVDDGFKPVMTIFFSRFLLLIRSPWTALMTSDIWTLSTRFCVFVLTTDGQDLESLLTPSSVESMGAAWSLAVRSNTTFSRAASLARSASISLEMFDTLVIRVEAFPFVEEDLARSWQFLQVQDIDLHTAAIRSRQDSSKSRQLPCELCLQTVHVNMKESSSSPSVSINERTGYIKYIR